MSQSILVKDAHSAALLDKCRVQMVSLESKESSESLDRKVNLVLQDHKDHLELLDL